MSIRLIAGRAGSGKTHLCLSQIAEALTQSLTDGPRLILLVPEQAGLQMERAILARTPTQALGRCDVLSFRRLAQRILSQSIGPMPQTLTPIGRQMAVRYLLNRHRKSLREFAKVAHRRGVISAISTSIIELLQESITVDQLDAAAKQAIDSDDPSASRLHDTALLFRKYLEYLGSDRVDPEGVLDLARDRLGDGPWLSGARIWVDGFAGITPQQMRMLVELARRVAQIDVALLIDPRDAQSRATDNFSLFARTQRTWQSLARHAAEGGIAIDKPILLNSSPRFDKTPTLAALERSLFSAKPHSSSPHGVRLVQSTSRQLEAEAVAAQIIDLVQRDNHPMRYRDIAIVVRDLEPYHQVIAQALAARNIPFFIDRRRPAFHHPLVQWLRAALTMHGDNAGWSVISLLKNPLSGINRQLADFVENYLLAHGLENLANWDREWIAKKDAKPHEQQLVAQLESFRKQFRDIIGEWWPAAQSKTAHPSAQTWVQRLTDLRERLAIADRLTEMKSLAEQGSRIDELKEHEEVEKSIDEILTELVAALGEEQMTARQFRDVVEAGLAELTLGLVPPTLDQVLVSAIERSRHPPVRAVFLLGFNDGQFPARTPEDSILGDSERESLARAGVELTRTHRQHLLDERMLVYVALTRPSEQLWISYVTRDDTGRELAPSSYWASVQAALPGVQIETLEQDRPQDISSISELTAGLARNLRRYCEAAPTAQPIAGWTRLYDWARLSPLQDRIRPAMLSLRTPDDAVLTPTAAAAIWKQPHRTSVTQLESFGRCPYQHFLAYGLRLKPREIHAVGAEKMGELYHLILEQFVTGLMDQQKSFADLSPADIAQSITDTCQQIIPNYVKELGLDEPTQRKLGWRSNSELRAALKGQQSALKKIALKPVAVEHTFGDHDNDLPALRLTTKNGHKILIRGKIDRIDLLHTADQSIALVFDYKRSKQSRLNLAELFHGLSLQLLAYLLILREHGSPLSKTKLIPGGAFYLPLLGKFASIDHPSEADEASADQEFRPRGIIDFDFMESLEAGFTQQRKSIAFNVQITQKGGIYATSDAVPAKKLPILLDFVQQKMNDLSDDWLSGNIAVAPAQLGKDLPCTHCSFKMVCRFDYAAKQIRRLPLLRRADVLQNLLGQSEAADE